VTWGLVTLGFPGGGTDAEVLLQLPELNMGPFSRLNPIRSKPYQVLNRTRKLYAANYFNGDF